MELPDYKQFENDLKNLIDSKLENDECVHVTALLSYRDPPKEEQLIRGKLYHLGIEMLLRKLFGQDIMLEQKFQVDYFNPKNKKETSICFTPDGLLNLPDKTVLIEIKSTINSRDYATKQTSIYKYLLEKYFRQKINECWLITGDLKITKLNCDSDFGQEILNNKLAQSSLLSFTDH
ncbi:hypothetical protein [Acidianus bottle-shaped virus 3 strain ABV3]|uniref:Uncharacterized protein n=1 Tax=Acidianus bottle-shaped virus 3 strain ABV3 TaxID=1732174 RepID=A0A0N9NW91_9VIRU|nr:hypothetical protein AVU00_gp03 [Acidianus bottle-shaped virus 3 strain ABV3]ALG96805.1 hypothetical protein [Acidianus bottle-shaped virus 3 strain ABV3]